MVCRVKATALEKDRYGMEDAACFTLALGANTYWLFIKPLPSIKVVAADTAFILIDWHLIPLP
jgi:hypothetical protein